MAKLSSGYKRVVFGSDNGSTPVEFHVKKFNTLDELKKYWELSDYIDYQDECFGDEPPEDVICYVDWILGDDKLKNKASIYKIDEDGDRSSINAIEKNRFETKFYPELFNQEANEVGVKDDMGFTEVPNFSKLEGAGRCAYICESKGCLDRYSGRHYAYFNSYNNLSSDYSGCFQTVEPAHGQFGIDGDKHCAFCAKCFSRLNPKLFGGHIYKMVQIDKKLYLVRDFKTKEELLRHWVIGESNWYDESVEHADREQGECYVNKKFGNGKDGCGWNRESGANSLLDVGSVQGKSGDVFCFYYKKDLTPCDAILVDKFEKHFYPEFFGAGPLEITEKKMEYMPVPSPKKFFKVDVGAFDNDKNFRTLTEALNYIEKYYEDGGDSNVSIKTESFEEV